MINKEQLRQLGLTEEEIKLIESEGIKEARSASQVSSTRQAVVPVDQSQQAPTTPQVAGNLQTIFDRTWDVIDGRLKNDISNLSDQVVTSSAAELIADAAEGLVTSTADEIFNSVSQGAINARIPQPTVVNDFTGGVDKIASAETVKILNDNKFDKNNPGNGGKILITDANGVVGFSSRTITLVFDDGSTSIVKVG